jgi:DNA modification methylase
MKNEETLLPGFEGQIDTTRSKKGRVSRLDTEGEKDAPASTKTVDPRNALNELTSTEWLPETISVWTQRGLGANHPDAQIERQHPAPFSFTDVARLVRFFTKRGQTVLDPFVGVGSTLKACATEGRKGIGFELNSRYAELARERLETEVHDLWAEASQDVKEGDARELVRKLGDDSIDLVVTSPPYWKILHKEDHKVRQERVEHALDTRYGDDSRDLGNIHSYPDFLQELAGILGACARPLKNGKHMAVVASDFRDKSKFIMFHADLARALEPYGLEMRGLTVLYQRHKRIFPYGYPYAYVPNIHNQFILILQNVKPKAATKQAKSPLCKGKSKSNKK